MTLPLFLLIDDLAVFVVQALQKQRSAAELAFGFVPRHSQVCQILRRYRVRSYSRNTTFYHDQAR